MMANQEQIKMLKQGKLKWNAWRDNHQSIPIDLTGADLSGCDLHEMNLSFSYEEGSKDAFPKAIISADLSNANMRKAILYQTNLHNAILRDTDLSSANLSGADLSETDLRAANLSGATLYGANLTLAFLAGANLSKADLSNANLTGANLEETNLSEAELGWTVFGENDLRKVKGLLTIKHIISSTIGIDTLVMSKGQIPEAFLRGAGVPESIIENIFAVISAMKPIDFYSCFISYSSKDQLFTERLYNDLQGKGVRCWYAPKDLKAGDKFWYRIDESIRLYDKLLLILSKNSVESPWVENEVMAALEKEHNNPEKTVLFPIRIDEEIMETHTPWAASFRRSRHILDFTKWKEPEQYQKALEKLFKDLNK
jgi:uncharacterized protein YjbI with pentapeptide repeats